MLLFVRCALIEVWRLLNTLWHPAFPLQAAGKKNLSVGCCVWPSPESWAVWAFAVSWTTQVKSYNPAAAKYSCRKTRGILQSLPRLDPGVTLRGTLPPRTSSLDVYLTLRCAHKTTPKTGFVLCSFPLSKQHLSPPSSNKRILEARLIVVAFPLNRISYSCLWGSYKFQHLCTLSFQVSLTFIGKDNIKLQSLSRSPPLLPSTNRLAQRFHGVCCGWSLHRLLAVSLLSLHFLPWYWAVISMQDLHLHLPSCCFPISVLYFEGLGGSIVLWCSRWALMLRHRMQQRCLCGAGTYQHTAN